MPARNSSKEYLENGYYHIYNRGVEKRKIFLDLQDYNVFLSYLKAYLLPKEETTLQKELIKTDLDPHERARIHKLLRLNNFHNKIELIAYCLMPNHFHFLVKQTDADIIDAFMNSFATRYTMYFNRKYQRVGSLYQGVYKAVLITTDEQLLHLTRYIHQQAMRENKEQPSSYPEYLQLKKTSWVKPEEIMAFFSKNNPNMSYESFVIQDDDFSLINRLLIEEI